MIPNAAQKTGQQRRESKGLQKLWLTGQVKAGRGSELEGQQHNITGMLVRNGQTGIRRGRNVGQG